MRAIVILYDGPEVSSYIHQKMVEPLIGVAETGTIDVVGLDNAETAKAIVKSVKPQQKVGKLEAQRNALIYVGTVLAPVLSRTPKNHTTMVMSASGQMKTNSQFYKAMEIIYNNKTFPENVMAKYNISVQDIEVLQQVFANRDI